MIKPSVYIFYIHTKINIENNILTLFLIYILKNYSRIVDEEKFKSVFK